MLGIIFIIAALLLVLLNGFFVAAEFSLVKIRPTRLKIIAKQYGWRGRILLKVHREMDAYLSGCQLGITLASLGLGWVGEPAFARVIEVPLHAMGIQQPEIISSVAIALAFFLISFLHIVVGELAPKSLAIRQSEAVGIWTAPLLYGFYWSMYPAIWLLNHSANRVLHLFGLDRQDKHEAQYSTEELKQILRGSRAGKDFTANEWRVLAQALDFRDLEVGDLMRPFTEAVTVSAQNTLEENLACVVQHQFSRFPLMDGIGGVLGVIHIKDLFFAQQRQQLTQNWRALARPAIFVLPSLSATELFRRFQRGTSHFAIVAFSDGHPIGFITLENVLEALVGGIHDEFRLGQNAWIRMENGSLMGKASLPIFSLEQALGIEIEQEEANSVGGMVLEKLGALPHEGQTISFGQFSIIIKQMDGPRIAMVCVIPDTTSGDFTI